MKTILKIIKSKFIFSLNIICCHHSEMEKNSLLIIEKKMHVFIRLNENINNNNL